MIKNDLCHSVKAGGSFDKKEIDDGYQILVDTYNVYDAGTADTDMYTQAEYDAATDGMYTQAEYDAAAEDMFTQTDVDDAVAEATEDMYTQAEYDAATGAGANAVYTQDEYEDAVIEGVNKGIEIKAANLSYAFANDGAAFDAAIDEDRIEYMESICSGEVFESGACNQH